MTFQTLFEQLSDIDWVASSLIRNLRFHSDDGLGDSVCPLTDSTQDAFLRDKAEQLLELLELLHEELDYLNQPVLGEFQLERFPNGRYGYFDSQGNRHSFSCGNTIEAKIHDYFGTLRWVKTRLEHDGDDYFLWSGRGVPLSGLTIRKRGEPI